MEPGSNKNGGSGFHPWTQRTHFLVFSFLPSTSLLPCLTQASSPATFIDGNGGPNQWQWRWPLWWQPNLTPVVRTTSDTMDACRCSQIIFQSCFFVFLWSVQSYVFHPQLLHADFCGSSIFLPHFNSSSILRSDKTRIHRLLSISELRTTIYFSAATTIYFNQFSHCLLVQSMSSKPTSCSTY